MLPPDFTTFWKQALQQGFKPKAASVGKAILFPVRGRGARQGRQQPVVGGVVVAEPSVQVVAHRPERQASSPTPIEAATKKQWTQPIGFIHSLFEVGDRRAEAHRRGRQRQGDGGSRSPPPTSTPSSARCSGTAQDVPPFAAKNVTKTPLVGGQWRLKDGNKYDIVITDNQTAPSIPVGGKMEADRLTIAAVVYIGAGPLTRPRRADRAMLLEIRRLCKSFGSLKAADGIDLARRARARRSASSARTAPASRRCSI